MSTTDNSSARQPSRSNEGGGAIGVTTLVAPAVQMVNLAKTFGSRTVLHPFELSLIPGEIHALLGQNGSGKSTLIKILSGFHLPDEGGNCYVKGEPLEFGNPHGSYRTGLRFVHQDLGLISSSTVLDNLAFTSGYDTRLGAIRRNKALARAQESLSAVGLDVNPHALVATLTPAQRTGVAVARAIDFGGGAAVALVLDEPTATLPTEEVEHLHSMLRVAASAGVAILYVTHHLDEVFRLADQVSVLRDGYLVESCPVSGIDRATIVHRLVGSELEAVQRDKRDAGSAPTQATEFTVSDLRTEFIRGVSLTARAGEILGVYGLTGSGRESLLGAIFGALPRDGGIVRVNDVAVPPYRPTKSIARGIGYLSPDRKISGGFMHMNATENLTIVNLGRFWKRGMLRNKDEELESARWFERLQVRPLDGLRNVLASFSGGNQQKIVLGKWLRMAPKVLLLDEPTQGVDVGAKAELHRQIIGASTNGAVVIVSSTDVEELASLCDRVLIMRNGEFATELVGDSVNEADINRSFHGVS
jgi:ribose transport system ATP-binding protein